MDEEGKVNDRSNLIATPVSYPQWKTEADLTSLIHGAVHIWRASTCQSSQILDQLLQTLSSDEQDRIKRLQSNQHRYRAIASRGILRSILAHYLTCNPKTVQFQYGIHGKPGVNHSSLPSLEFNLSHSEDLIVCAIALQSVGIDVEFLREVPYRDQLIKRYFSLQEQSMLNALPAEAKNQAFFEYWTGKEAMLKATGLGIFDLKKVELNSIAKSVQLSSSPGCDQSSAAWHLYSFEPSSNYFASIAIAMPPMQLKYWQW
ncbi:4'-phosphopantetheinyl transferase superfamily protein [Leptolyngbyaceae cyanobacterium UHCC 1019]